MKLVIARYSEDIEWSKEYDTVIYNKGTSPIKNSIILPNVGREGHTYLWYIIKNYKKLDKYTCFLQGNPFDHSPHLHSNIKKFELMENKPSFWYLSEKMLRCRLSGCPYHRNLPLKETYLRLFPSEKEFTDRIKFGAGAQFIVSKKCIQQHPVSFYKNALKILEYSKNPIEGFCIERFWGLIFDRENMIEK